MVEAEAKKILLKRLDQLMHEAKRMLDPPRITSVTFPVLIDGVVDEFKFDGKVWTFVYSVGVGQGTKFEGLPGTAFDETRRIAVVILDMEAKTS